jgi:hypothetical protein
MRRQARISGAVVCRTRWSSPAPPKQSIELPCFSGQNRATPHSPNVAIDGGTEIGRWEMNDRFAARAVARAVLAIGLVLAEFPARAAVLDEQDTARLAGITEAIQAFENDVGSALHNLTPDESGQIESYAYVELNLEAAHERLNTIFMLVAASIYMDSASDQFLVLSVMYKQLLTPSKNYLSEKKDAIASMAAARPANKVFAAYSARATAIIGDRAIPLLDELYQRIGALQR